MNIDWDNARDVFVAWEEAGDKVHQAVLLMESQLKSIKRSYAFDYIPLRKSNPPKTMSETYESKVTLTFTFEHDTPEPSKSDAVEFVEDCGQFDRGCIEMKVLNTDTRLCETTIHEEVVDAVCSSDAYHKVNDLTYTLGNDAWDRHFNKQTPAVQEVLKNNKEEIMKDIWHNFSCRGE